MFHIHRWSKWTPHRHYIDTSWGGEARSTMLIRRCRCGLVKVKSVYGVLLSLEEDRPSLPNPGIAENGKVRCNAPLVKESGIGGYCEIFVRPDRDHRGDHRLTWSNRD